jgi:hypothetical protein
VELHVQVESARDLPKKDWLQFEKSSDPYCVVTFNRQRRQTEPIPHTTSPTWDANYFFLVPDPSARVTPLCFKIWDHDFFTPDDEIGECCLSVESLETILAAPRPNGKSAVRKMDLNLEDQHGQAVTFARQNKGDPSPPSSMLTISVFTQDRGPKVAEDKAEKTLEAVSLAPQKMVTYLSVTVHKGDQLPREHADGDAGHVRSAKGRRGKKDGGGGAQENKSVTQAGIAYMVDICHKGQIRQTPLSHHPPPPAEGEHILPSGGVAVWVEFSKVSAL